MYQKNESILRDKSRAFAIRIVNLCKHLRNEKREYVMAKRFYGQELQ